jgi:poly(hydroxyalkanoate) granule-associated protein
MSKKNGKKSSAKDFQEELKDVAQKVWLAGLGALSTAEEEGSKLFKKLVARGQEFEEKNRPWVEETAKRARVRFEEAAETAKTKFESAFEDAGEAVDAKVGSTLERLGVPSRDEIHRLTQRVEELNAKLEALGGKAPKAAKPATPRKPAVRKPAAKKTADA